MGDLRRDGRRVLLVLLDLPKPQFRDEDGYDLVRQAVFLQEVAHPSIRFSFESSVTPPVMLACDRHQFGQAITNVLKNAVEAIEARAEMDAESTGQLTISLRETDNHFEIEIMDNGIGLPEDFERITEPYVTTREKGTGLGLAIVKKIVEEHGGDMSFAQREQGGSRVALRFARFQGDIEKQAAE